MGPFRRIVVAVDFSEVSDAAWQLAGRLGGRDGALLALNVVVTPPLPNVAYANIPAAVDEQRRENEARMARLAPPGGEGGPRVERRVVVGDVAKTIVDTAREMSADLVVVGSERHRGGVAEAVVRDAACHILVVRAGDQRSAGG